MQTTEDASGRYIRLIVDMTFVHQLSCEGIKGEMDLFSLPATQTSIEHAQWIEHRPVVSIGTGGPIEFLLPRSGDNYVDVAVTCLMVRARVVKSNGTNIDLIQQMDAFAV